MDRADFELIAPFRLADLHREAAAARRLAALPRRSLVVIPALLALGRLLVEAGHWLQRLDQACPNCPAPAH